MADPQDASSGTNTTTPPDRSFTPTVTPTSPDPDAGSEGSDTSGYFLQAGSSRVNDAPKVFQQSTNRNDFKRQIMAGVEMTEAFEGAQDMVSNLNPEYFRLAPNTRVINLKIDTVRNLFRSVRFGKWATLEKVSQRITNAWAARVDSNEKILFLIAINGQKQFCGIAEMSGPWSADDFVDGWEDTGKGARCVGAIPITWHFVKDVPYGTFHHVHQKRNNQPVVNMWNGMLIEPETVNEVIETYVTAPHYTNVLAWPKHHRQRQLSIAAGANPKIDSPVSRGFGDRHHMPNSRGMHRGNPSVRGSFSASRNVPALAIDNWRRPQQPYISPMGTAQSPANSSGRFPTNIPTPGFDGSQERGSVRPGQVLSFILDENNEFVPVTPHGRTSMVFPPMREHLQDAQDGTRATANEFQPGTHSATRGAVRGGGAWRGRGTPLRGARSPEDMRNVQLPLSPTDGSPGSLFEESSTFSHLSSDHPLRGGREALNATVRSNALASPTLSILSSDHPLRLRHTASATTLKHKKAWTPPDETAIYSAPLAKPSGTPHAPSNERGTQQKQPSFDLRQAATASEFKPQSHRTDSIFPCPGGHNPQSFTRSQTVSKAHADSIEGGSWRLVGLDMYAQPRYQAMHESGSDHPGTDGVDGSTVADSESSYPSDFKSADSMAGYTPRTSTPHFRMMPDFPNTNRLQRQFPPHKVATPTPAPRASVMQDVQQNDGEHNKAPVSTTLVPVGGPVGQNETEHNPHRIYDEGAAGLPSKKKSIYYSLMSEKLRLDHALKHASEMDPVHYCDLMARKSQLEENLKQLGSGESHSDANVEERRGHSAGSSVASSIERFNISPERRADGGILQSASRAGSPSPDKKRRRAADRSSGPSYDETQAALIKKMVEKDTHKSPTTSSVAAQDEFSPPSPDEPASPPAPTTARRVYVNSNTNSWEHSDNGHSDGGGGIRLES